MFVCVVEFFGVDLVFNGIQLVSVEQIECGICLGLCYVDSVEFFSVIVIDQGIQFSSIKVVGDCYFLCGQFKSVVVLFVVEQVGGCLQVGEVWVELCLLVSFDLKVGDSIEIGCKLLCIVCIFIYELDCVGDFYSLMFCVMMSLVDFDVIGVVQLGSWVCYCDLWEGLLEVFQVYCQQVKGSFVVNQCLQDVCDGNCQVGDVFGCVECYLNLVSLVVVLFVGVVVVLFVVCFVVWCYDVSVLLCCFGLLCSEILFFYVL